SHVVRTLRSLEGKGFFSETQRHAPRRVLHSFSYTALRPFRFAKDHGWHTVLEQIDAGPLMQRMEDSLNSNHLAQGRECVAPPPAYWETWRQQCVLSDRIIVNSLWTRAALLQEGIPAQK